jgi:hypothetical protein
MKHAHKQNFEKKIVLSQFITDLKKREGKMRQKLCPSDALMN